MLNGVVVKDCRGTITFDIFAGNYLERDMCDLLTLANLFRWKESTLVLLLSQFEEAKAFAV